MADRPTTQNLYVARTDSDEKSAGQLMKEVTEDLSTLIRKEVELAKQELGASVSTKVKGAVAIAIAAIFGLFALVFLLLSARDGLDVALPTWLADLVTAAILILLGAITAAVAWRKLAAPISTRLTQQTLREDVEWAKTLGRR